MDKWISSNMIEGREGMMGNMRMMDGLTVATLRSNEGGGELRKK